MHRGRLDELVDIPVGMGAQGPSMSSAERLDCEIDQLSLIVHQLKHLRSTLEGSSHSPDKGLEEVRQPSSVVHVLRSGPERVAGVRCECEQLIAEILGMVS